jgi:periplasmic protein TonB
VHAIIPVDERPSCADPPDRRVPAFSVSLMGHGALLLGLMLAFHEMRESNELANAETSAQAQLVWIPVPGASGGGGGGGNQTRETARPLQRSGADRVTTPAVRTSVVEFTEREPEHAIHIAALPLAAHDVTLPGAMDNAAFSAISLGPGTNGAGGRGDGGLGPGDGPGFGPGVGGNQGDGPRGGGSVVTPTVLRSVKPRYTTEAMRAHIQGTVLVRAIVRPDGTVGDVRILRSLDPAFGLDQEAVRAAAQWLFRPALMGGQPVSFVVSIELVFSLR